MLPSSNVRQTFDKHCLVAFQTAEISLSPGYGSLDLVPVASSLGARADLMLIWVTSQRKKKKKKHGWGQCAALCIVAPKRHRCSSVRDAEQARVPTGCCLAPLRHPDTSDGYRVGAHALGHESLASVQSLRPTPSPRGPHFTLKHARHHCPFLSWPL